MPLPTITASLGYIAITYDIRVPGKYLYLVIVLGIESGFFFLSWCWLRQNRQATSLGNRLSLDMKRYNRAWLSSPDKGCHA